MKYGYFDDKNREYVITDPKTPTKWINYLGTLQFGGIIDQTGGMLLCKGDPALNRITKYITQLPAPDMKGSTIYVRIKEGKQYKVFSPVFVPTLDKYDKYECHVGLSYQKIISEFYGLHFEITYFVPNGSAVQVTDIKVTNNSGKALEVDVIPVVEYTHPDALKQLTNADWVPQTMASKGHKDGKNIILEQYPFMYKKIRINFLTSNQPVSSFEADRRIFLGDNEYGTWRSPLALQNTELTSYEPLRGDNIGALMHHLGKLKPREEKRLIVLFGQNDNLEKAKVDIHKYRNEKNVDKAFSDLGKFWDEYLSKMTVKTPDESFNTMVNIHNPRQCHTTKNWSRYLSYYQLGYGARGLGFRDSSQDVLGILMSIPEEGKELIKKILSVQKKDGSAMHQFNPITMVANEGDSREEDGHKYYGDDHLWIIISVLWYIKETGDFNFLKENVPYYEKQKDEVTPVESGTVLDHLTRAIDFTHKNRGAHGLPLLGFADWNDTVNLKGKAESMFVAHLYGKAIQEMIELFKNLQATKSKNTYEKYYNEMKEIVNKSGWDGQWYIRYFEDNGHPIGSHRNPEGKIYTNAQSWPVIAGYTPEDRAKTAMDSVNKLLNTKYGIKLSTPGYNGFDWRKGGVTTYPPGTKENGGIFLHANPWVMIAETIMGNGNRAFQYYQQINPAAKNNIMEIFESEPYNYPQNILGDEHPKFGLGRNGWLSGTSTWTYTAATKFILGVRPTYTGLEIDPCIPKDWKKLSIKRVFRDITFNIEIDNSAGVSKGVGSITVNGKEITGNIIPITAVKGGKEIQVKVAMGKGSSIKTASKKTARTKA
ncbi:GH36-type glycosyl hydrolase domain-containing protein [Candidatus Margulisiibacteriota bacterium]